MHSVNFSSHFFVIRHSILQSSEICGSYSPLFAMKIANNTTKLNVSKLNDKTFLFSYKQGMMWTQ